MADLVEQWGTKPCKVRFLALSGATDYFREGTPIRRAGRITRPMSWGPGGGPGRPLELDERRVAAVAGRPVRPGLAHPVRRQAGVVHRVLAPVTSLAVTGPVSSLCGTPRSSVKPRRPASSGPTTAAAHASVGARRRATSPRCSIDQVGCRAAEPVLRKTDSEGSGSSAARTSESTTAARETVLRPLPCA